MSITTQAPTTTTAAPIHLSARGQLKDYCLRRLGAPVIEINVDDQQVEDRIQDAIEFFQEYHYDAVERTYAKNIVTGTTIRTLEPIGNTFTRNEVILGMTSGAAAFFYEVVPAVVPNADIPLAPIAYAPADPAFFYVYKTTAGVTTAPFLAGETVVGQTSGVTGTIAPNGYTVGNWDQQYFALPDNIMGISKVFPVGPGTSGLNSRNIFDVVYQFRLNDLYNLMSADMTYYAMTKMYLETLDMLFPGDRSVRFNRKTDRLYIDFNWYDQLLPQCYVITETFVYVDPESFTKVYNDYFLKKYATALIKRQWGENLKKFSGVQMLGGVTLNGQIIYDEAIAEITKLEDEMQDRFEEPPAFFVG